MRQLKQRLRTSRKANNRWTGLSYASSYTELRSKGIRAYAYIYLTQKLISVFTESSRKAIKTHFLGDREVQRNRNLQSFSNPSHDSVRKKAVYSWFSKSSGVHICAWTIFQPPQCRADSRQKGQPGGPSTYLQVLGAGKRARPSLRCLWTKGLPTPLAAHRPRLPPARTASPSLKRRLARPDAPGSSRPPPPVDSRPSAGPAITHGLILRICREHRSPEVQLAAATTNHADTLFLHHLRARARTLYRRPGHELPQRKPVGRESVPAHRQPSRGILGFSLYGRFLW